MDIEKPSPAVPVAPPDPRGFWRDLAFVHAANALVAFLFAASGPLAIILATGTKGGLSEADLASWVFGSLAINGVVSIGYSLVYRQPLAFFWTIPGTILVGSALDHLTFPQVIGAYIATGLLMLALGVTGWVRRAMQAIPMPIVMGMVAGVFLAFGLDWVRAFQADPWIAAAMTAAFLAASAIPPVASRLPPLIVALGAGAFAIHHAGWVAPDLDPADMLAAPRLLPAGALLGGHGRAGGAAGDHRAGGPERPGHRRVDRRGPHAAGRQNCRRLRRHLARGGLHRRRADLSHRPRQRHHLRQRRAPCAIHRRRAGRACSAWASAYLRPWSLG